MLIVTHVVELNMLMRTRQRVTSRTILAGTTSCRKTKIAITDLKQYCPFNKQIRSKIYHWYCSTVLLTIFYIGNINLKAQFIQYLFLKHYAGAAFVDWLSTVLGFFHFFRNLLFNILTFCWFKDRKRFSGKTIFTEYTLQYLRAFLSFIEQLSLRNVHLKCSFIKEYIKNNNNQQETVFVCIIKENTQNKVKYLYNKWAVWLDHSGNYILGEKYANTLHNRLYEDYENHWNRVKEKISYIPIIDLIGVGFPIYSSSFLSTKD